MTLEEYCNHKIEHGIKVGIEEALEKARDEVKEEVRIEVKEEVRIEVKEEVRSEVKEEDILNLIKFLKSNNTSDEKIVSALMEVHSLTKEKAEIWLQNN